MFDLLTKGMELFKNQDSYDETAGEATAQYSLTVAELPSVEQLDIFLKSFPSCDNIELSIKSYLSFVYSSHISENWRDNYIQFVASSESTDEIEVTLYISKSADSNALSVYSLDAFVNHYNEMPFFQCAHRLSESLKKYQTLKFNVLNQKIELITRCMCFCNSGSINFQDKSQRADYLKKCNSTSVFFSRNEYALTPFDFEICKNEGEGTNLLTEFLNRAKSIFSYLFLASSSYIAENNLYLYLTPESTSITIPVSKVVCSEQICDLFFWTFGSDSVEERAGIVRSLLKLNCKVPQDLLSLNEEILASAKSNYIIYQKKIVDKYLDLKDKIGLSIVEATKQMQEIFQTLIDAVKNNFIAVIMFLVTVIITDSISWDDLKEGTIMNPDLILVIHIFIISSLLYWLITIVGVIFKTKIFMKSYSSLKNNYSEVLDPQDLARAFDNDNAIKYIKKKIIWASIIISVLWLFFLVGLNYVI